MNDKPLDKLVFRRDGQTQNQRLPFGLLPSNVPLDGRTKEDFYRYVKAVAAQVNFPDIESLTPNGTWEDFFASSPEELKALSDQSALPSHLALWDAFLHLFQFAQQTGNTISKRHLDFYYNQVLHLKKNDPQPDQAFVLFELKKNIANHLVKDGMYVLGGKDNTKKERRYKLLHDIVVNSSSIASLRNLFINPVNKNLIHHAPIANSADGLGAVFSPGEERWSTFGNKRLPLASIGFCFASEILKMKEGDRTIDLEITVDKEIPLTKTHAIKNAFVAFVSGENGWIGPKSVTTTLTSLGNTTTRINFKITISSQEPAIINYNQPTHEENFKTTHPIVKLLLNNEQTDFGYNDLTNIQIEDALVEVDVKGVKDLRLENDFGLLDPKKPFMPFGNTPEANTNFMVLNDEVFSKRLKEFTLDVEWKNIPADNLGLYFNAYGSGNKNQDFTATAAFKDGYNWEEKSKIVQLFNTSNAQSNTQWHFQNPGFPQKLPLLILPQVSLVSYVYAGKSPAYQNIYSATLTTPYIATSIILEQFSGKFNIMAQPYKEIRKGQFQLRLRRGFLFKEYRRLYAQKVLGRRRSSTPLPSEPFSPEIQALTLNYKATTAKTSFSGQRFDAFIDEEVEFFHQGAFGQKREHSYLKTQHPFVLNHKVSLLPEYTSEGSFFVGLSGLAPEEGACLLFKVAEGSANPEKPKAEVTWSVLCDNYWKPLSPDEVILDTTQGFLTSGVIKFIIPREATTSNTLMDEGLIWLRATVQKDSDAVCQLINVHANAAIVQFENNNNDPYHLSAPLASQTINKLEMEAGGIKSVKQPYASFNGRMQEDDESYYIRCAERLRHKGRCVTLWDYERLILQHFPSIHTVKCINHASPSSFHQPGHDLILVVPDLTNQNAINRFQPKVDKTTLENIKSFIDERSSPWLIHHVSNPFYEPVQVSARVKLKQGYEFRYYGGIINERLQQFLSPWLDGRKNTISFQGKVSQAAIVKLLEEMPFIDFVSEVGLSHYPVGKSVPVTQNTAVEASSPAAVLVSHHDHTIRNY